MDEDADPYLPPKRNERKEVRGEFVRFALRLRIVPVCLSIIVGLLAVLWTLGGVYAYLTSGPPIDWELFLPFLVFAGLFLGLINFLAAWCWMKGHFFGGFIANLCSPLPLGVFVICMEIFETTF